MERNVFEEPRAGDVVHRGVELAKVTGVEAGWVHVLRVALSGAPMETSYTLGEWYDLGGAGWEETR